MTKFRNCLFFTLKLGLVTALISSVGLSFRKILTASLSIPFMESIHIIYYSCFLGLVAGAIGFWLVYPVRARGGHTFRTFSMTVAMLLGAFILQFTRAHWESDPMFQIVLFPIAPVFLGVVSFVKLAKMHIYEE